MPFTKSIEHVVVLMMENHSFDNMLGWWSGELTGNESNESADGVAYTTGEERNPPFMTDPCPGHAFPNVNLQVFGTKHPSRRTSPPDSQPLAPPDPQPLAPPDPQALVTMGGFVKDYVQNAGGAGREGNVMGCYSPKQLPVMTALANNFTVCSRWFASVPGPTAPNRIYANCASSRGYAGTAYNNLPSELADLPSTFSMLEENGLTWGVYYESSAFVTEHVLAVLAPLGAPKYLDPGFNCFLSQILKGDLPNYCFLTPGLMPNSQHPNSDVRYGECVMANIYEMIANSRYWEKTLFIITYDEHGGFYDSVPTPTGVPNPDGHNWDETCPSKYKYSPPPFNFDRLGVRVPALLISPWVAARIDATQYEHSSIPATVAKLFGLSWPVTTNQRINTVNTFETAIGCELRTNLPTTLPRPPATYIPLPTPAVLG